MVGSNKTPAKERLSLPSLEEDPNEDNELGSRFTNSEPDFDVICNFVSILPAEYDMISEIDDSERSSNLKTWGNTIPCVVL